MSHEFDLLNKRGRKSPLLLKMIKKELITKLIDERIAELDNGLYVVELTISSSNVIRVELDKLSGGVTVTDCMSVSRNVEHNLDREEQDFELHVSSAGLDKSLRHINQYKKNIGRELDVILQNGQKFCGEIVEVKEKAVVLLNREMKKLEEKKKKELVEERYDLSFSEIKEAKIVISFK